MTVCLFGPTTYRKFLNQNIQMFHDDWTSVQLSRENEHEGLLPDCRVSVKQSKSEDYSSWMHWQYAWQLTFWTMVWVWRSRDKAGCEWQSDSRVYTGFRYAPGMTTHIYIAWILLLVHNLTVKLSHSSLAGRIAACLCRHSKCNLFQDDSASY